MRRTLILLTVLTATIALGARPSAARPPQSALLIRDVTVIDGTGAAPSGPLSVSIVDGRIAAIGVASEVRGEPGARVIDGSGRYLIPGLIDAHAHVTMGPVRIDTSGPVPAMRLEPDPAVTESSFELLLEHGVTTIRDPGGDTERLVSLREAIEDGERTGPRMRVAGAVIDQTPFEGLTEQFTDEAELRAIIRSHAEAGVDFVKLYVTMTPELMEAAVEEAHAAGVGTIAHTLMISWTDAARLGLDAIVHILPGNPGLLPEESRERYIQDMATGTQFMATWFEYVDLDSPIIDEMIDALVEHGVTVDPTLVMWETIVRGDDPEVIESPWLDRVPASMLENWRTTFHMNPGWQPADFERARAAFPKALELTRRLHEAGVMLTAGTDANNPWVVPGVSLHRELELLVEAGIPPLEVLTIATRNGAAVIGLLDQIGTVQEGKVADLLLLSEDPSRDISATRSIVEVIQGGSVLAR